MYAAFRTQKLSFNLLNVELIPWCFLTSMRARRIRKPMEYCVFQLILISLDILFQTLPGAAIV